jgi:DNA-directed RNA polymerase specialized sigma subunit
MDALSRYLLESGGLQKLAAPAPAPIAPPALPISAPVISAPSVYDSDPEMEPDKSPRNLQELAMWKAWKQSGYQAQYLRPLQQSLSRIVASHVNKWKAANVPTDLLEMHAQQLMLEALKDYNPNNAVAGRARTVGSHVFDRLKRLQRFVVENQNAGRVVEARAGKNIRVFQEATALLQTEFGRDPTATELAERMTLQMGKPVTVKQVEMFQRESRRDRNVADENFSFMPTTTRILLKLLPEELTPLENQVFERFYGVNGSKKMKPGEIARSLNLSGPRVSRILNTISEKAAEFM